MIAVLSTMKVCIVDHRKELMAGTSTLSGPYSGIKGARLAMRNELTGRGLVIKGPYIEIYGHWTSDENRLETELIMALR